MIDVDEFKEYQRINFDDDDRFISRILTAGYDYLRDAVDDFDVIYEENKVFTNKADLFVLTMYAPDAYNNREGWQSGEITTNYAARSLLTQLSLYKKEG